MPPRERQRWLELLSYVQALVYHVREPDEQAGLRETIAASVRTDENRREVLAMGKTIAEALKEEGRAEGMVHSRRETLLRLLRKQFRRVPRDVAATVEATTDLRQLDAWVDRILTARTLEEMGIPPAP